MSGQSILERMNLGEALAKACENPGSHPALIAFAKDQIRLYSEGGKDRGRGYAIMLAVIDGRGNEKCDLRSVAFASSAYLDLTGYMTRRQQRRFVEKYAK